jgi:hypothetical protein
MRMASFKQVGALLEQPRNGVFLGLSLGEARTGFGHAGLYQNRRDSDTYGLVSSLPNGAELRLEAEPSLGEVQSGSVATGHTPWQITTPLGATLRGYTGKSGRARSPYFTGLSRCHFKVAERESA